MKQPIIAISILAVFAVGLAFAITWHSTRTAHQERTILLRFVCESVYLRESTNASDAAEWRARITRILDDLNGYRCQPKRPVP